jgi:hypothetical protein
MRRRRSGACLPIRTPLSKSSLSGHCAALYSTSGSFDPPKAFFEQLSRELGQTRRGGYDVTMALLWVGWLHIGVHEWGRRVGEEGKAKFPQLVVVPNHGHMWSLFVVFATRTTGFDETTRNQVCNSYVYLLQDGRIVTKKPCWSNYKLSTRYCLDCSSTRKVVT